MSCCLVTMTIVSHCLYGQRYWAVYSGSLSKAHPDERLITMVITVDVECRQKGCTNVAYDERPRSDYVCCSHWLSPLVAYGSHYPMGS
jgi:hypothetical protein